MSEPFVGQITVFPYSFPPYGWADCAGQLLPIQQHTALFSLIGNYYGGNGQSNFALPDLQGRIPVHQGTLPGGQTYNIGEADGAETVTVLSGEMGSHNHSLNATTSRSSTNAPINNLSATAATGGLGASDKGLIYNAAQADTALVPQSIAPAGGSQPHNNLQPYLVLRYCIALNGVFPARS
jgi:microcystin-dependent protein